MNAGIDTEKCSLMMGISSFLEQVNYIAIKMQKGFIKLFSLPSKIKSFEKKIEGTGF